MWVRSRLCKLQKGCTRLATARDKVYQLLAHGRWLPPASSTTKAGRHDISEILQKWALKHQKYNRPTRESVRLVAATEDYVVDGSTELTIFPGGSPNVLAPFSYFILLLLFDIAKSCSRIE